jgi:hypothetical protein
MRSSTVRIVASSSSKPPCVLLALGPAGAVTTCTFACPAFARHASKYVSIPRMGVWRPPSNDWETR